MGTRDLLVRYVCPWACSPHAKSCEKGLITKEHICILGLKRIVHLLSGYPDAIICEYPTDSDNIKLVYWWLYILNLYPQAQLNIVA